METLIECPKCSHSFELSTSLTQKIEQQITSKFTQDLEAKSRELEALQSQLKSAEETVSAKLEAKYALEMEKMKLAVIKQADEDAKKKLAEKDEELKRIKDREGQLEERVNQARKLELDMIDKEKKLKQAQDDLEISIIRQSEQKAEELVNAAKAKMEEEMGLKMAEKELELKRLQERITQIQNGVSVISSEKIGESFEDFVRNMLTSNFAHDTVADVSKGEKGADLVHQVRTVTGKACGTIVYEAKNTKTWGGNWIAKIKSDLGTVKGDIPVIVSTVMPNSVKSFDVVDGVWVTKPEFLVPLVVALRDQLIRVSETRIANEGQQTKAQMMYEYLMGVEFRRRVEAIVEAFKSMNEDLDKEKKFQIKQWSKREKQIASVVEATMGMYGDMQGIAGQSMQELDSMTLLLGEGEE